MNVRVITCKESSCFLRNERVVVVLGTLEGVVEEV